MKNKNSKKVKIDEFFWKEFYSKAKPSDLELLNLPSNFVQLTTEQKYAIESIFYPTGFEDILSGTDDIQYAIRNLQSAVNDIEQTISELNSLV